MIPGSRPLSMRRRRASVHAAAAAVLGVLVLGLVACTAAEPAASRTPPVTVPAETPASPEATAEAGPTAPVLVPEGTAEENLPLFTSVVQAVGAGPDAGAGRAYIDALTAAGFDRGAMQVTQDASTVGNAAESVQFSVRWAEECLVGQVGPATGAPVSVVLPGLVDGTCLLGQTRAIDW